jgi:signal peptidase I
MTTYAVAIAALVAMAFIRFAIVAPFKVRGRSMEPTLRDGVGDIVLLRNPEPHSKRRVLLKRVTASTPVGAYFVVGDNAAGSRDSRHFGYVLP